MLWSFLCSVLAEQLGVLGKKKHDHRRHCGIQQYMSEVRRTFLLQLLHNFLSVWLMTKGKESYLLFKPHFVPTCPVEFKIQRIIPTGCRARHVCMRRVRVGVKALRFILSLQRVKLGAVGTEDSGKGDLASLRYNEMSSPYCQETESFNLDDTTTIHGQNPRQQNRPWFLDGRNGILTPLSITAPLANHGWSRVDIASFQVRYAPPWCTIGCSGSERACVSLYPPRLLAVV